MIRRPRYLTAVLLCAALLLAGLSPAAAQTAPGAPANLQASVAGNGLSLSWAAPPTGGTPTGYTLLARVTPGGGVLAALPVGNVNGFAATGPNGTYVISVVASNAAGTGPESTAVTVTLPTVPPPPGPPTAFSASVAGDTATFTWTPPTSGGAVSGYVLIAGVSSGFAIPIATAPLPASSPGLVVPGVPAGTYYLRVVAQNAGGTSAPSNEAAVTVAGPMAPGAPTLNPPGGAGNTLSLSWTPGGGGAPTSYVLTALTPGGAVLATVPLAGTAASFPGVPNGTYVLRIVAVNAVGSSPASNQVTVTLPITGPPPPIAPIGNDITSTAANFGRKEALSANGQRLVVAAEGTANGTVRVYDRVGAIWTQVGGDLIGEASGDHAGSAVDISASGSRIAIGAYLNGGGGGASGHVRVYDLVGSTWTQVGQDLDGANGWGLGYSLALSADGTRLVAGAPVVGGDGGFAKVYELSGGTWNQLGATLQGTDEFGTAVAMSADGTTIAVSSPSASGLSRAGTVVVYRLSAGAWTTFGAMLQGEAIADNFGDSVSLSADGTRIVVGAPSDREGGVSGGGSRAGKVRVFAYSGGSWAQLGGDVLGGVGLNGENLGATVHLSDNGTMFAANGPSETVARVYRLVNGAWTQVGATITNTGLSVARIEGLALSADGGTVATGFVNGGLVRVFSIAP